MSEEVMTAIGDIDFWKRRCEGAEEERDAAIAAHRAAEQECAAYVARDLMIQAVLTTHGRVEGDGPQGRVACATLPALARVLAVLLIKPDGTLYNYVEWAVAALPDTGPLSIAIQRGNGKTPGVLVNEAHADVAAMRQALDDATTHADDDSCRYDHHGYCQTHGLSSRPCYMERARAVLATPNPGAPLLAIARAARAYRAAVEACDGIAAAEAALFQALDGKDVAP